MSVNKLFKDIEGSQRPQSLGYKRETPPRSFLDYPFSRSSLEARHVFFGHIPAACSSLLRLLRDHFHGFLCSVLALAAIAMWFRRLAALSTVVLAFMASLGDVSALALTSRTFGGAKVEYKEVRSPGAVTMNPSPQS